MYFLLYSQAGSNIRNNPNIIEEEINTDINTDSNQSNGRRLTPKTILRAAQNNLETIEEGQKEDEDNNVKLKAGDDNKDTTKLINNVTIGTTDENDVNKFTVSNEKVEMDNIRVGANDKIKVEKNNKEFHVGTISMSNNAELEYHGQDEDPTIDKLNAPNNGVFHIDQADPDGKMNHMKIGIIDIDQENAEEQLLRNRNEVLRAPTTILRDPNDSQSAKKTTIAYKNNKLNKDKCKTLKIEHSTELEYNSKDKKIMDPIIDILKIPTSGELIVNIASGSGTIKHNNNIGKIDIGCILF